MLSCLFLLVAACSLLESASTFTNPLREHGADPAMVYVVSEDYYYLLNTASHGQIEMVRAQTLEGLKTGETKKVWSDTTVSRCCSLWAPEIHYFDGT